MGVLFMDQVADRLNQMRLSKADPAIDKERVIRRAWMLGYLDCRRAGQLIGLTGNEGVESERRIEPAVLTYPGFTAIELGGPGNGAHRGLPRSGVYRRAVFRLAQLQDHIDCFMSG